MGFVSAILSHIGAVWTIGGVIMAGVIVGSMDLLEVGVYGPRKPDVFRAVMGRLSNPQAEVDILREWRMDANLPFMPSSHLRATLLSTTGALRDDLMWFAGTPVDPLGIESWARVRDALCMTSRLICYPAFRVGQFTVPRLVDDVACVIDTLSRAAARSSRRHGFIRDDRERLLSMASIVLDIVCGRACAWLGYADDMFRFACGMAGIADSADDIMDGFSMTRMREQSRMVARVCSCTLSEADRASAGDALSFAFEWDSRQRTCFERSAYGDVVSETDLALTYDVLSDFDRKAVVRETSPYMSGWTRLFPWEPVLASNMIANRFHEMTIRAYEHRRDVELVRDKLPPDISGLHVG